VFERILLGVGRRMVPVPECLFRKMVKRDAGRLAKRPALEPDERRVQHLNEECFLLVRRRGPHTPQRQPEAQRYLPDPATERHRHPAGSERPLRIRAIA